MIQRKNFLERKMKNGFGKLVSTYPVELKETIEGNIRDLEVYGNSEQETFLGSQLIDFANITAPNQNVDVEFENDVLTVSSSIATYARVECDISEILKNNIGKKLCFSWEGDIASSGKPHAQMAWTIDGKTTYDGFVGSGFKYRYSLTVTEERANATKALFQIYSNNSATNMESSLSITKPILYFGELENSPEYEPYVGGVPSPNPEYPSEIKSCGDEGYVEVISRGYNLLPVLNESQTKNGVDFTINADGTITANGTATSQIVFPINSVSQGTQVTFYIEKNTYKLDLGVPSSNTTYFLQGLYKKASGETMYPTSMASKIAIEENVLMGVGIIIRAGVVLDNVTFKPMLFIWDEKGIPYQQYRETKINFPLTEPLRKTGDVADYIDWKNRQVVRNIAKVVLDGSRRWQIANKVLFTDEITDEILNEKNTCLSDCYKSIPNKPISSDVYAEGNNVICFYSKTNGVHRLYIRDDRFSVTTEFKTWLSSNNVTVIYQLATPTYEPFTEEQNAIADLILTPNYCNITSSNKVKPSKIEFSYKSKVK